MQKATGHIRPRKRKDGQKAFQLIAELPPDPLTGKRQRKYLTIIGTKKEAEKLGFKRIIMPENSLRGWTPPKNIEIIGVNTVAEALSAALS